MSHYAIGDIQGCYDEFRGLLDAIEFDAAVDTAWLVGDLVNRGPASLAVLRHVRSMGKAARVVLDMIKKSSERGEEKEKVPERSDIRAGISSGAIVAGALQEGQRLLFLASGEPIELARRFCALNRFYGSRALMDTATFDRVNEAIVARPIDFVSGLNSHDRLEVYEPLCLAAEAGPERVAQRDSFWSGVVLYREQRWAEAYNEFQKARGSDEEEDAPLQFYLRRLEPLLLQLTQWSQE